MTQRWPILLQPLHGESEGNVSHVWRGPVLVAEGIAASLPWTCRWSDEFVDKNVVKAAAVGVGLIWNFLWYKYWVYAA